MKSQVTIYTLFIIAGTLGNTLILWAVLGRESMRTARNVFIGTLATSDLFLCLFTMPSTLWEVTIESCNFSQLGMCLFELFEPRTHKTMNFQVLRFNLPS